MKEQKKKEFSKEQELITAAVDEFSNKGYEKASLNNILSQAGISKGTFYYHFKNKEDLYLHLIEIFVEQKKKFFSENIEPEDLEGDIFALLQTMAQVGLQFAKAHPQVSKFSTNFLKEYNTPIYHKMLDKVGPQTGDYLEVFIERAYARGELRDDLPKEFTTRVISYLFTHIQAVTDVMEINDFENAAINVIKLLRNGLASKQDNQNI